MSEAETLRLTAEVADRFSAPLRSLRDHLAAVKAPSGLRTMQTEFDGVGRAVDGLRQGIQRGLRPELDAIGLKTIGLVGAFAAVTAALRSFSGSTNDLRRLSSEVGITAERLRVFGGLAERAGIDPAAMSAATRTFAQNMRDIRVGVGSATTFMLQQGPGVRRFAEELKHIGSNDAAFVRTLEFLRQIPDSVDRMRVAQALLGNAEFGRLGLEDIKKLLREVAEEQGKLPKGAEETAHAFEISMGRLQNRLRGLKDEMGVALLPALTELTESATKFLGENREAISGGFADFIKKTNWGEVRDDLRAVGTAFADIAKVINSIVQSLGGWENASKVIIGLWAANKVGNLFGGTVAAGGAVVGAARGGAGLLSRLFSGAAGRALGPLGAFLGMTGPLGEGEDAASAAGQGRGPGHNAREDFEKGRLPGQSSLPYGFDEGMKRWANSIASRPYEEPLEGESENDRKSRLLMHPASFGGAQADSPQDVIYKGVLRALVDFATQRLGAGESDSGGGLGGGSGIRSAAFRSSGWHAIGGGGGGGRGGGGFSGYSGGSRGGAAPGNTGDAMRIAMDQLGKEGVPEANRRAAAALLVGQAISESQLKPDQPHDTNTGYGIYGARLGRRDAMLAWMRERGFARNSLEGQMRYMAHEAMSGRYAATRRALLGATPGNLGSGSRILTHEFESPKFDNDRSGNTFDAFRRGGSADPEKNWGGRTNSFASPSSNYPEMGAGRGGEAAPVGSFLRGDAPWSNGGGADLSRKARESGALGSPVKAEGSVNVTLEGFPKGVKAKTSSDGLFQLVKLNRGRAMAEADA